MCLIKNTNYYKSILLIKINEKQYLPTMNTTDFDISIAAGNIVSNALQLTRNLFCPFCAEAYMFEFTLKEHLKKSHHNQLKKQLSSQPSDTSTLNHSFVSSHQLHNCPFCGASFILFGLIPKHILMHHGVDIFNVWKRQDANIEKWEAAKENEPPIVFSASSSGLTDFFDEFSTTTSTNTTSPPTVEADKNPVEHMNVDEEINDEISLPAPKSILKKTPSKINRIICSPSSAAIRRSKSDVVKRSVSCRRELRFDPSTKKSPPSLTQITKVSPKPKKNGKLLQFVSTFLRKKSSTTLSSASNNNIITSTPINLLDNDDDPVMNCRKNWKSTIRKNNNRPLFFDSERYQCAFCKKTWESNDDLLTHLAEHHRGVKQWLRPQYRCSLCGATFYHNSYLIKHCQIHHNDFK